MLFFGWKRSFDVIIEKKTEGRRTKESFTESWFCGKEREREFCA